MTTFKEIRGTTIEVVSSDPANPELGQIWYNSSSGTLKGYKVVNAWSSGGNLNTARTSIAGMGTQTAALGAGGETTVYVGTTESYNGSSWTTVNSLNTARAGSGTGIQTAALVFGGFRGPPVPTGTLTATESWTGTSWTSVNSLNTARVGGGRAGTQTAALTMGGQVVVTAALLANTESWNGTSWTSVNNMNTARTNIGCGIQTAAVTAGGNTGPAFTGATELWNGTTWTNNPTGLNTVRSGICMAGTQTAALGFGGNIPPLTGATELWNGSTWTSNPTGLGTARSAGGNGTQTAAIIFGGELPGMTAATEEWTGVAVQTITVS
jgi:hypothetical protein